MIANLYDHLKLRVMDNQPRPFIYAFSALVTLEVIQKAKESGFDDCLSAPLTVPHFEEIVMTRINQMALSSAQDELEFDCYLKLQKALPKAKSEAK